MERPHKHYRKQNLKKHWVNIQSKKCAKHLLFKLSQHGIG